MNVTCHAPCLKSSPTHSHMQFSMYENYFQNKRFFFCFSSHGSFIGHTPIIMLDHPPIFFIGHTPKILWTTLQKYYGQPSDIYCGQHSENTMDNTPKILWTTLRYFHWIYSENTMDNPSIFSLDCHASIPSPTQFANPNRVRGARPYTGTLYLFFFLKAELVPVGIRTISVITKIINIHKRTTTGVVSIKI